MTLADEALHTLPAVEFGNGELFRDQLPVNHVEFGLRLHQRHSWLEPACDQHPTGKGSSPASAVRLKTVQRMEWYPQIRTAADGDSRELGWSDADHRKR